MSGRDFQVGDLVKWGPLCDGSSGQARIVDFVDEDLVTLSGHGDRMFNLCYITHPGETTPSTATRTAAECDAIKVMLLAKNAAYGDSATDPVRVFSKASPTEQILIRIDDKVSRLTRGHEMSDESRRDTIRDMVGYWILLLIAEES